MNKNAEGEFPARRPGADRGRRLALIVCAVLIAPFFLLFSGLILAPSVTYALILHGATGIAGLGPSSFAVKEASFFGVRLAALSIGRTADITAREASVNFGKLGILSGVKDAAIDGLRVRVTLGGSASAGSGPVRLPALSTPFPLRLSDFQADIVSSAFRLTARGEGLLVLHDGIDGALALALTPQGAAGGVLPHAGTLVFSQKPPAPLMALHFAPQTGGSVNAARVTMDVVLSQEGTAPLGLTLDVRDVALPQSAFSLGALSLKGTLTASRDGAVLKLHGCGPVTGLGFAGAKLEAASLCPLDRPFLSLAAADREALRFALALGQAQARLLSANGESLGAGLLPQLAITASSDLSVSQVKFTLDAQGGALNGPAALVLRDVDLNAAAATSDGRLSDASFTLKRAVISGAGAKPWLAPVSLSGDGKTLFGQFRFALDGAGGGIAKLIHAEGKADLKAGSAGEAHFVLPPLSLTARSFAPEGLFPGFGAQVSDASGRISADGAYAWGPQGVQSGATLTLAGVGAHLPQGQLLGLSGTIALSSLAPLATAQPQTLRVSRLDFGLPLTDGVLRFALDPGGAARILEGHLDWLGGQVGLSSGTLSLAGKPQTLTFVLKGIDLEQLLAFAKVKNLSGTGRISGRIPVTISNGRQTVSAGTLTADAPGGTLVYKTGQASANPTNPSALLYTALDDFHYDTMSGELSGDLAGTLSLRVHLKGRNPALYDGRQVELNVSTEGAFVDMVRKSLYGYRSEP